MTPLRLRIASETLLAQLRMEAQRPAPMPIRQLVALRRTISDRVLMDYLHLWTITGGCGVASTATLREAWGCDQSTVSRRVNAVAAAGLADITTGRGGYWVNPLRGMG